MTRTSMALSPDKMLLTLRFSTNPPAQIEMSASTVEDLLSELGERRSQMTPAIPKEFAIGTGDPYKAVYEPRWAVVPNAMDDHTCVHIRHPELGWMHFLINYDEAKTLGESLLLRAGDFPAKPSRKV